MKDLIADKLFNSLLNEITSGKLLPGVRLKEQELAERLGCSRGPLREALRRLEAKRVVDISPNIGAQVVRLTPKEISDLYIAREALEGMAAAQAAKYMELSEIAKLRSIINSQAEKGDGDKDFQFTDKENLDFHYRIVKGGRNKKLYEILCIDLYYQIMLCRNHFSTTYTKDQSVRRHLDILEAVEMRDPELAEMLMRRHIREAKHFIVDNQLKSGIIA